MRHGIIRRYDPPAGFDVLTLAYDYPPDARVPEHAHGAAQVIYAVQGVMEVTIDEHLWLVPPHFAIYVPTRKAHSIRMYGIVSMRTIYVRSTLLRKLGQGCSVLHVSLLLRELMLETVRLGRLKSSVKMHRALRDMVLEQLRTASSVPMALQNPSDERAAAIATSALTEAGKKLSLEQLCKRDGVGVRTVQRAFRQDTGMTFTTWRDQARLIRGIQYLIAGQSVKQCAYQAGFSHASAFIAVFRKTLGSTPKAWATQYTRRTPSGLDGSS